MYIFGGNGSEYITIDKMDFKKNILPKDSASVFELEWLWDSNDEKDMQVATTSTSEKYYTLSMHIYADAYQKGD